MEIVQIFYCSFWISAISIVWFYTDWFIHYSQLFAVAEDVRLRYLSFIIENPGKYFPDFLYMLSLQTDQRLVKFVYKLLSCPFCLLIWMSIIAALLCSNLIIAAPIYVVSLFTVLQIRNYV